MPTNLKPTDVVIVGMGAAGSVAALPLAQAGVKVIGLEAGTWLRQGLRARRASQQLSCVAPLCAESQSRGADPQAECVGVIFGSAGISPDDERRWPHLASYWAQSWRLSPWDFKVVSETTRRYGASRIPAGSTVEDWPFGADELERYYDIVEHELGVSGKAGNINGQIDRRGNIFEAPRRREYPMPPLRWTDWHQKMANAARGLGWNPFPGPAAVNTRTYEGRSGCAYHGFCSRGGCHVNAKGSTAVTTIPKAQKTGRLEIVTEAHVTEVNVDGNGRVTGVTYMKGTEVLYSRARGAARDVHGRKCAVDAAVESKAFPNGLANNHGQAGKHYITHATGGSVQALFPMDLNNWYGLPAQGVAVDDFADDNFDHSTLDFIGGGNLFVYSDRRPIGAASMNMFGKGPSWGSKWKAFVKQNADRWHGAYIQKTTLPYEDNYLDWIPGERSLGLPVCRITADFKDNERKATMFVADKMEQWYRAAGSNDVIRNPLGTMGPSTTLWRHTYGRQRRNQCRQSVGLCTRSTESRYSGRIGDGHEWRTQSDIDGSGSGVADRGIPGKELESARVK